jgi:hypothetical protein
VYRIIKISLLLLLIISVQGLFGQTSSDKIPNGIAIQSVARDASGNAASNRNIFLKVELRQGTSTGESVLVETHSVTSNDEGIFNLYFKDIFAQMPIWRDGIFVYDYTERYGNRYHKYVMLKMPLTL